MGKTRDRQTDRYEWILRDTSHQKVQNSNLENKWLLISERHTKKDKLFIFKTNTVKRIYLWTP